MRIAFAIICLAVIGAVAAVGADAIDSARDLSVRQRADLDSAIDRIVAEHKENKRREAALASAPPPESRPNQQPAVFTDGRSPEPAERPDRKISDRKIAAASQQKNQQPRAGRVASRNVASRNNILIPQAFLSLPKFAASTLFGLR